MNHIKNYCIRLYCEDGHVYTDKTMRHDNWRYYNCSVFDRVFKSTLSFLLEREDREAIRLPTVRSYHALLQTLLYNLGFEVNLI